MLRLLLNYKKASCRFVIKADRGMGATGQQNAPTFIDEVIFMVKNFGNNDIDYETLVHKALRDVVKNILKDVAIQGLPGDHHFYICYATPHPLVQLPDYLHQEYPEDMTIVLQHEYWDLVVDDTALSITLCFDEVHERIVIPFDSIISFVDPSVKFGLQFNPIYPEETEVKEPTLSVAIKEDISGENAEASEESNVITVDFSKRK
ncbi:MAG: hypothetical protein HEEMFOPI_01250 [Holosporales bacterium]